MNFIYVHIHILRIWTILSLHESTHLIGTKSIEIRIGKGKRQRKTVRYFASNDYQNLYHLLQPGRSTAALGKGEFVRERTENNPRHILGPPGHTTAYPEGRKLQREHLDHQEYP